MNMKPNNDTWHPKIENVVYWGMDWQCPTFNLALSQQLTKYYGKLTPQVAIRSVTAVEESGDNHVAYYDLTHMQLFVSFAAPHNVSGPAEGYARQFTQFDVNALLTESPPVV